MSTISRPRLKTQAFIHRWQVEIVELTGSYVRNAGSKSVNGVGPIRDLHQPGCARLPNAECPVQTQRSPPMRFASGRPPT